MYEPHFAITSSINRNIAEIERIRTLIEQSRILPTRELILRKRAIIEITHSSTGIEGNPLTEKQVAQVLSGKLINVSERFITEVKNYKEALSFVEEKAPEKIITTKDILRLHRLTMQGLLPPDRLGKWRKTPVYVVNIHKDKDIIQYQGPNYPKIPEFIGELLDWIRNEGNKHHPVIAAGILHYEFVSIHPFADGNGRITRLLTLLYLYQHTYSFRKVLVPDSYYFQDRRRYYQALSHAKTYHRQRTADITDWLEYFVEGFLAVAKEVKEKITIAALPRETRETLTLSSEQMQIISFIQDIGRITVKDAVDMLEVPLRTAQHRLKKMVNIELIVKVGKGRATYYKLKE